VPGRPGTPRFFIHATNVQSGALWRFTREYMGDYRVGRVMNPTTLLAVAVAASSAFPPILSPARLKIDQPIRTDVGNDLHREPYTSDVVLSDGGVYDNLALETAFGHLTTVLVSDGGMKMSPDPNPKRDWARHAIRVLNVIDNQVRSLRKRFLIDAYVRGDQTGTYWGIATHYADYKLDADPLGAAARDPAYLATIDTRLKAMPRDQQERLINWGYAVCDAALRKHWNGLHGVDIAAPRGFPYGQGY
jgi:NTE family protein